MYVRVCHIGSLVRSCETYNGSFYREVIPRGLHSRGDASRRSVIPSLLLQTDDAYGVTAMILSEESYDGIPIRCSRSAKRESRRIASHTGSSLKKAPIAPVAKPRSSHENAISFSFKAA